MPKHYLRPIEEVAFAHPAERLVASILSFYRVRWVYEPTVFPLTHDERGAPTVEMTPDFYLPDHRLYLELTVMRQALVTKKNRKLRQLRERYPTLDVRILYRRDIERLVHACLPVPQDERAELGAPLLQPAAIAARIDELAVEVTTALSGGEQNRLPPILLAAGEGSLTFHAALGSAIRGSGAQFELDQVATSRPRGVPATGQVRITRKPGLPLTGRDVILVADVASSGLTLNWLRTWVARHGARSVRTCVLLDRESARLIDVPIDFRGFTAPDRPLAGFGLVRFPRYRNLNWIAPVSLPAFPPLFEADGAEG